MRADTGSSVTLEEKPPHGFSGGFSYLKVCFLCISFSGFSFILFIFLKLIINHLTVYCNNSIISAIIQFGYKHDKTFSAVKKINNRLNFLYSLTIYFLYIQYLLIFGIKNYRIFFVAFLLFLHRIYYTAKMAVRKYPISSDISYSG